MNFTCSVYLADLVLEIVSTRPLETDARIRPFLTGSRAVHPIRMEVEWSAGDAPQLPETPVGADGIQTYYRRDGQYFCVLREGPKGILSIAQYDGTYRSFKCYVNPEPFGGVPQSVNFCLRMLPLRAILQHYGIRFFHAAQIAVGQTGILFTAPSGTGKTTQARLWKKYRDARIVCSDRTLVRDGCTWGLPLDGSEPVSSTEQNRLGAIVAVAQSPVNRVQRLRPAKAMQQLLPQMVVDIWDAQARETAARQLMELLAGTPVYRLECTMEEEAVRCLEAALREDGVI